MEHVEEARLNESVFTDTPLTAEEVAHLEVCRDCYDLWTKLHTLAGELAIARASTLTPETAARYAAIFVQARQAAPSRWARATRWIQAQLTFDSRTQALAAGVRSSSTTSCRLLFAAEEAEIELMVEHAQGRRRLMGEVVDGEGVPLTAALVELALHDGSAHYEAETDEYGRFQFADLVPGDFALVITPSDHAGHEDWLVIQVASLEIA